MICHRRRLVFVHLRRTGGNSVEAALGGIVLFDRYFRFSIVRNPWEQMASLYGRLHPQDRQLTGFRNWLWQFSLAAGTVPQASLFDETGRCLVDFIGRFERLDEDFAIACDRAGLPPIALPHANAGGRLDVAAIYDDASIRIVERLYAADIERFGYAFGAASHHAAQPIRRAA